MSVRRTPTASTSAVAVLAAIAMLAAGLSSGVAAGLSSGVAAPGAPGEHADWTAADKHGFGTSRTLGSTVWFTLREGELSEVYYPDLGTPALRDLEFVITGGQGGPERTTHSRRSTRLVDGRSPTFRQTDVSPTGRWRMVRTYVTDPSNNSVLMNVRLLSLDGQRHRVFAIADAGLSNSGADDSAAVVKSGVQAWDDNAAMTMRSSTGLRRRSVGYLGTSDGRTDLMADGHLDHTYSRAHDGNVVLTGRLAGVSGRPNARNATLVLGFGANREASAAAAASSLAGGWAAAASGYADGWHRYFDRLRVVPASARQMAATYRASVMVLASSEDKRNRGAFIASPSMPWQWGDDTTDLASPSNAYHLVWARDLYQHATALFAAGDKPAAVRALRFVLFRQQQPDGSFPQNSLVDGTPSGTNLQMDEVGLPLVLAWQLGQDDPATYARVKRAANFMTHFRDEETGLHAPFSPQERWENQSGFSPGTIAAEIAGLVCAASIADTNGDHASARSWRATAHRWASKVDGWTATSTGPYSPKPYYLRLTKDGHPNRGTVYNVGDGGNDHDQRAVVDPSFLELVRLGIKRAWSPTVRNSLAVVDRHLAAKTRNGTFWHRYTDDGYGEDHHGREWRITDEGDQITIGRVWPIFAGERGEYQLQARVPGAETRLRSIAAAANDGRMISEQVWDHQPPAGSPGFAPGTGTFSATPLTWSHAQFVRLAWSIDAGRPVEQPSVVSCAFLHRRC